MKKFLCLILALVLFTVGTNVYATSLLQAGETVVQEGEYNSIRFVAGNNVKNMATVNGINLVAGNQLNLEGTSEYGFFAGNVINVNENVLKDLFVAGNNITIGTGAILNRDVFIAGNYVTILSDIKRDLRVGAESVNISGITINGDAFIESEKIIMDENTVINGKLVYYENSSVTGLDKARVGSIEVTKIDINIERETVKERIISFIMSYIAGVITIMAIIFAIPGAKEKLNKTSLEVGKIFKSALLGFAVLIVIPVVAIITLFTGVLTPLALIILAVYIIALYLSQLVSAYVVGNVVSNKLIKKETKVLGLLIGVLLVKLVDYIPVVGGLISAFLFLYGLGLIYKFIASRGK